MTDEFDPLLVVRFHAHLDVVADRLRWLRAMNPGTPIVGFYGGPKGLWRQAAALEWDDCYRLRDKIDLWKWQYGDMHLRKWYRRYGKRLDFDYLCLCEWDLVFTAPLGELYAPGDAALCMTQVRSLDEHRAAGWDWLVNDYLAPERKAFEQWAHRRLAWAGKARCGWLPGALVRRDLLERYARVRPPRGGNDEFRLGVLADAWDLPVGETGFYRGARFNCDRVEVTPEEVMRGHAVGERVFHPVYQPLGDERLAQVQAPPARSK